MPSTESFPFRRLTADHMIEGNTHVWWDMAPLFNDPTPHLFQLQVGNTGLPNATDWLNVGTPVTNGYYAVDDQKRQYGKRLLTHYRVVLTTPTHTFVSYPVRTEGRLGEHDWVLAREIIRKSSLLDRFTTVNGYLLKRRRFGVPCTRCLDPLTGEITDSRCPNCRGVGFKTGYHPPVLMCLELSNETVEELRNGAQPPGQNRFTEIVGGCVAFPQVSLEDVWVDGNNDQRWFIHTIKHTASLRGVPLLSDLTLRLAPFTDMVYRLPVGGEPNDHIMAELPTAGTGSIEVTHDTGGEDALAYQLADGCGIEGATILAILKTDYDAGLRSAADAVAATVTEANGRWAFALLLDPGTYILVYERLGSFGPDTIELTLPLGSASASSSVSSISSVRSSVRSSVSSSDFGSV